MSGRREDLVAPATSCTNLCQEGSLLAYSKSKKCTGSAAHASYVGSAACAALPERLQAAPAQLPAQQPARRGAGQGSAHRPVVGGMCSPLLCSTGTNVRQGATGSSLQQGMLHEGCASHSAERLGCTAEAWDPAVASPDKAAPAAEALVPAHAFQGESAMRQRLMARLGAMQGSSAANAGPAQPGSAQASAPDQAAAAALGAQAYSTHAPHGNARGTNGESHPGIFFHTVKRQLLGSSLHAGGTVSKPLRPT